MKTRVRRHDLLFGGQGSSVLQQVEESEDDLFGDYLV